MEMQEVALRGSWTHSFEEDEAGVRLYRPTHGYAFPPSRRGRETLDFDTAGQVLSGAPGPDDRPRLSAAALTPLGMNRFRIGAAEAPGRVIEVLEARPDLLKLRYA